MENKAFNHLKDQQPKESFGVQLNEDTRFLIEQNLATMNSGNLLNHDNSFSEINSMLRENPAQFPTCANLLGNLEGESQLHDHDMVDNNDYIITGAPMFSNAWIPENSRSSLNTKNSMTDGVMPHSLYGETTLTSHFNDDTMNFEDAMAFPSLFGKIHGLPVDNTINNGDTAELEQFLTGSITTETGSDRVHISKENCASFTNSASQFNTFQTPQTTRRTRCIGGKTADGVGIHCQGGTSTGISQVRGVNSNGEIRFTSLFNNSTSSQTEKNSLNIGSRPNIIRRNNRSGVSTGTSHIQGAKTSGDNSMSVATQFHGLRRSQINNSSIKFGGETATVIQPTSQGERLTGRYHVDTITIDDDDNEESVSPFSNLQGQQVNNSLKGDLVSRSSVNSQDKTIEGTNLASTAFLFEGVQNSMADRNFLSVGSDMPEVQQSQIHEQYRNNVKANSNQSNNGTCSEQIDNSFLNLGFGGNANVGLVSNGFEGTSSYNEFPVTTQLCTSHEPDWNFLSLGGNLGDQTWSNNRNTIISGTNAGAILSPYTSLGGNMENQTWSNNVSRMISGSHAGVSNPFTNLQTVQGNVQQYVSRPSGTTLGTRGTAAGMNAYTVPYRGFHHGHSGMDLRPPNSTPAGLHANEQVRVSSLPVGPNFVTGISNRSFPSSLPRSYTENVRHFLTNSAMASSLTSTATRTFQPDQSGHPVPVNVPIAEAARGIAQVANNSKNAQTGQAAAHICRRGKRVPADGVQYTQSAKVLLRPSVSGKPVPVAGHAGLTRNSEGLIAQTIQGSSVQNTSTTLRAPRARKIHQSPINPPVAFGSLATKNPQSSLNPSTRPGNQPNTAHYLKWKGPEDVIHSSGEKCHLCKRDLTYTPTGAVTQPSVPPAVAVLPCGHTFHDECLQLITPEDQLKSPPCIPCAIGNF